MMNLPIVTLQKLAFESGYTEDALRAKIKRGDFAEGIHFFKSPDKRIQFVVEEYLKWVESERTETEFKSHSHGMANASGRR